MPRRMPISIRRCLECAMSPPRDQGLRLGDPNHFHPTRSYLHNSTFSCVLRHPAHIDVTAKYQAVRTREKRAGSFFAPVNGPIGPVFPRWNAPARRQGDEEPPAVCHLPDASRGK